jgi:hypothetical protein
MVNLGNKKCPDLALDTRFSESIHESNGSKPVSCPIEASAPAQAMSIYAWHGIFIASNEVHNQEVFGS